MANKLYDETVEGLRRLKLSTIRVNLDNYLQLAETRSISHLEFLHRLIEEELRGRDESNYRRRLKAARFPAIKTLEDFEFIFQPSISESRINSLKECRWIENAVNVIFAGQAGVGKSHLSVGLGMEAIERGYKIYFTTVSDLLDQMSLAAATNKLLSFQNKLLKYDGIILDELGYERINRSQGNFLFRLISKAYEHTSIIVTTNKDFSGWSDIFEDKVQVSALLDRLLHHVVIFAIQGESYRIKGHKPEEVGNHDSE